MLKCHQCNKEIEINAVCGYLTCTNCMDKECPKCHKIKVYCLKKEKLSPEQKLKDYCYCDFGDGEKHCAICQSSWKGPKVYCYECSGVVDDLRRKAYRDTIQKDMKTNWGILGILHNLLAMLVVIGIVIVLLIGDVVIVKKSLKKKVKK